VGAGFSSRVQTGPEAHSASYTMGTGSSLGIKRQRRGVDRPSPTSAEVEGRVELYIFSRLAISRVNFTFSFTVHIDNANNVKLFT
jgi:hypothetical protein